MISSRQLVIGLGAVLALVAGVITAIYVRGSQSFRDNLEVEFAKTLLQLFLIGIIGVLAKAVVDEYVKSREAAQQAVERLLAAEGAAHRSRISALSELSENYWRIKKALHLIEAHKSAKTYGEQMRAIIDYRLNLQQLDNEIVGGMHALQESMIIGEALHQLDQRLEALVDEWAENYLRLSRLQKQDEGGSDPERKRVPTEIERLERLSAVRAERFKAIHEPFERAANLMRNEIWPERHRSRTEPGGQPTGGVTARH